jgi:hypothetical protein
VDGMEFGMGFEQADAAVPAEDAVVVANGTNFFGFGEIVEGFFDERKKDMGRATGAELGFGAALEEEAGVVEALVGITQVLENGAAFVVAIAGDAEELVGDGEAQHAAGELLLGFDGEDVAADGFGFLGLVEVAVKFDLGDGFGDACFGDGLQLVLHDASLTGRGIALSIMKEPDSLNEIPQQVAGNKSAQHGAAVTADGYDFVEVLDLQAVVKGVANAMRGVEERDGAEHEEIEADERVSDERRGSCVGWSVGEAEREHEILDEQVGGNQEGGDDTAGAEEEPQERLDAKFGWLSVHLFFCPFLC